MSDTAILHVCCAASAIGQGPRWDVSMPRYTQPVLYKQINKHPRTEAVCPERIHARRRLEFARWQAVYAGRHPTKRDMNWPFAHILAAGRSHVLKAGLLEFGFMYLRVCSPTSHPALAKLAVSFRIPAALLQPRLLRPCQNTPPSLRVSQLIAGGCMSP